MEIRMMNPKDSSYINAQRKYNRVDGPAVIRANGTQQWWLNGKRHREDGPAIIWSNGTQEYWINYKRHRVDGPAVIRANGKQEWWINGNRIYDAEIKEWQKQYNIPIDFKKWNEQHKMLFKLQFSYFIRSQV